MKIVSIFLLQLLIYSCTSNETTDTYIQDTVIYNIEYPCLKVYLRTVEKDSVKHKIIHESILLKSNTDRMHSQKRKLCNVYSTDGVFLTNIISRNKYDSLIEVSNKIDKIILLLETDSTLSNVDILIPSLNKEIYSLYMSLNYYNSVIQSLIEKSNNKQ